MPAPFRIRARTFAPIPTFVLATFAVASFGLAFSILAGSLPFAAHAQDRPTPVAVTVEGVFGPDALVEGGYTGVIVTAANRTTQALSGAIELAVGEWGMPAERHRVEVDLPPGETRRVQLTVFIPTAGVSLRATYLDDDGNVLGLGEQSVAYTGGSRSVVVISDQPARLRAALLDLQIEEANAVRPSYPSATGVTHTVVVPVGGCVLDGRTGDPILPTDPHAYATVGLVVASASTLSRVGEPELSALEDWVIAGGTLVLAPRSDADYALPVVRRFFGDITPWSGAFAASGYAPYETLLHHCSEADLEDGIGCARAHGQGLMRLATWDVTSPPAGTVPGVPETWSRSLVTTLLSEHDSHALPAVPFGRGLDANDTSWWDGTPTFGFLRRALDPNEGYRTSLALVAVLLFLYVLVVGPIHFKLIERRAQPTLALVTTPVLALICAVALFAVGYVGKGIVMRYRRFALLEARSGAERGTSRSYTGYFFTRPASGALRSPVHSIPRRVAAPGGASGPRYLHREDRVEVDNVRGGLWETVFVREERIVDLAGGIRFELNGTRITAVVNDSDLVLSSAFVVDTIGSAFVVGDIPAHGRAPVPEATSWYLYENVGGWYGEGGDATTTTLMALLRLPADSAPLARGLQSMLGTNLVDSHAAALYAWVEPEPAPEGDLDFTAEWDRRLLRVDAPAALEPTVRPVIAGAYGETTPIPPAAGGGQ